MRKHTGTIWGLAIAAFCTASCGEEGPADQRWEIGFACPSDATRTAYIQLKVFADKCGGEDAVYETNLLRDKTAPTEVLSPGTYHFEAVAYDGNANLVAGDCHTFALPGEQVQFTIASLDCIISMPMDGGSDEPEIDGSLINPDDPDGSTPTDPTNDGGGTPPPTCALMKGNCSCAQHANHTYLFCPDALDWPAARERCRAQGADLVVVDNAAENAFLQASGGSGRWLGANDRGLDGTPFGKCPGQCNKSGDEGTWRWVNAAGNDERGTIFCTASEKSSNCSASGYANWASQEPNNDTSMGVPCVPYVACAVGEDCAVMVGDGTWKDAACTLKNGFICESF